AGVVGLVAEGVEDALAHEGVRGDLDQTGLGQRSVRGATGALGPGEAATAGGGGQERGDRLVPDQAGDLLDQVLTDGQIGAPSGSVIGAAGAGAPPSSVTEAAISPPPCSTISWAARYAAASGSCGSTPRSKRLEASEGRRWRRAVRATEIGSKVAASSTMSVVPAETSVDSPPITPARPSTRAPSPPSLSVISRSSGSSVRVTSSRVVSSSPGRARRTTIGATTSPAS